MKNFKSVYSLGGIFAHNIAHYLYSLHMLPAANMVRDAAGVDGAISLMTSQGEVLTVYLSELPNLDEKGQEETKRKFIHLSTQILLSDCYEKLKQLSLLDDSEILQFFRHLRNACSHNGAFDIRGTIDRPARWRDKEIIKSLNGRPLFEFLAVGDSLLFLQDVEEHLFKHNSNWTKQHE